MVTSPSRSPLPKWSSTFRGGSGSHIGSGSGQLLDELEALSQALYQSQKKSGQTIAQPSLHPQPQSAPVQLKQPSVSLKDVSGRRFSHDAPAGKASGMETVAFSSLQPHDPPPSFTNLLSRHSLSSVHAPPKSFEQQKSSASSLRGRFSSSLISSRKAGEEKPDIRSRTDRRLSLQPSLEKSVSQEQQHSLEDSLESSRRFDSSSSEKKKSMWSSWKPLRALSHIGRQRLHCVFSAYVHAIEGLPPAMNGLRLCVHMRKEETKEGAVQTMPSRVFQGIAEFQETLFMKCTLYGNKGSSNGLKFMEKAFIVSVIAPDIEELDFGRHQLDLSRLLGDFLEERKGQLEKGSSWDTMLDLTGKAKGGRLAITFNYELLDKDSAVSCNVSSRFQDSPPHRSSVHSSYSLPNSAHGTPRSITTRTHLSHSPSASEPADDYDDMLAMDQLNLDEPPPQSKALPLHEAQDARGVQTAELQGFPAIRLQPECPPMGSQVAFNTMGNPESKFKTYVQANQVSILSGPLQSSEWTSENSSDVLKENDDLPSEEEDEFVVVDQGMEIDALVDRQAGKSFVNHYTDMVEEKAPEDLMPHEVETDVMDDLPQMVDIEVLDDPPLQMVDMEVFNDLPPCAAEVQVSDEAVGPVEKMEILNAVSLHGPLSQMAEKEEFSKVEGQGDDEERASREELQARSMPQRISVEITDDDKEVQQDIEKIVTVDEGERKDTVTYVMVMQTLDSLLLGTSAKELLHVEDKAELTADGFGSDYEDAADKGVISITSLSKSNKDAMDSEEDLATEVYEDEGFISEKIGDKECGGRDIEDAPLNDTADERKECGGRDIEDAPLSDTADERKECSAMFEESESASDYFTDEEQGKEEEDKIFEGEEITSFKSSDKEDSCQSTPFEEEEKDTIVMKEVGVVIEEEEKEEQHEEENEESVNSLAKVEEAESDKQEEERGEEKEEGLNASAEEEEGSMDVRESEKGSNGLRGEAGSYKEVDNKLNTPDANVTEMLANEENTDTSLLVQTTERTSKDAVFEDMNSEVDHVSEDTESEVDLVTGEFLDMLGMGHTAAKNDYDSEVDSPRARLWKEFEKEASLEGGFGLDFDVPEFSLEGTPSNEDEAYQLTDSFQALTGKSKLIDKKSEQRHYTSTADFIAEAEEDQTATLKGVKKEPHDLNHNSAFNLEPLYSDQMKGIDKECGDHGNVEAVEDMIKKHSNESLEYISQDSAKEDLSLSPESESVHWNHPSASKVMDEDLTSRNCTSPLSKMENKSLNLETLQISDDSKHPFSLEQMDEDSSSSIRMNSNETESCGWDETLVPKDVDAEAHKVDDKMPEKPKNENIRTEFQQENIEPSYFSEDSALKELQKGHLSPSGNLSASKADNEPENWELGEDEELLSFLEAAESELQRATRSMESKSRAQMLDDAETEALMQEWGLNEKAFVSSPPRPLFRQQNAPLLGKGLGIAVPLRDGGSLRSMSPSIFQGSKSSGKLVMQISKPLVVPAEMGSETADILRNMASMGIENMAVQAMAAMPLEDITGRSVEQVAADGITASKPGHKQIEGTVGGRKDLMNRLNRKSRNLSQNSVDDFVILEDIAPMAMQQIEALAMDGLKIQADVVEDNSAVGFTSFSLNGESGSRDVSGGSAAFKGVTGVHLAKGPASSADVSSDGAGKGLMGMAISLDEWMLLDAGLYDEAETNKSALAIMSAHHAAHQEIIAAGDDEKKKKRQGSKNAGARWGCMGNTLTIAMLVQLRDPLKNNEAVGAPMMAFVQAERMMKPPKMKVGRNVSMKGNSEDEEVAEEPQFKITGVHMSGMKAPEEPKKIAWGTQKQLQSGSRWLLANGMTKNAKSNRPMLGSRPSAATASASSAKANANKGESLWSISSRALTSGFRWRDRFRQNAPAKPK